MWKVLGAEAMYIDIAPVWAKRILELSEGRENAERFSELMEGAEITHLFNGSTETHNIMLEVPEAYTPEDIQLMADMILGIAKDNMETPFVEVEGKYQKCQVIINNEQEPELIGLNRTEGYGSGKIFLPILDSLTKPGRPNESLL